MKLRSRKRVPSPSLDEGSNGDKGSDDSGEGVTNYSSDSNYSCDDFADEDFYHSSSGSEHQDDVDPNTGGDVIGANYVKKSNGKNVSSKRKRQPNARNGKRKRSAESVKKLLWKEWEEDDQKWIDENLSEEVDFENHNQLMNEIAEAPPGLIMPLLRYQKEWLAWALKQENSEIRGGILADEMGMGKTIQAIALVLAKVYSRTCCTSPSTEASSSLLDIKATLVICPVVAVSQWVSEIDRFTTKGSLKVLVYHGAKREKSPAQFAGYDFVVTTYSIVESEYRRNMMPPKKQCPYCGKSFHEKKLKIHWRYFCGPDAMKTEKQSKQVKKSYPKSSKRKVEDALEHSVGTEINLSQGKSLLHEVKWNRIILDEAHYIKARHSNTAKAVFSLDSSYKWALSGTPLQNRVGELYSLVRFLQIVPYSYYLCKDCDCRTLDHRSLGFGVYYGVDDTPFYLENGASLSSPSSSRDCSKCGHSIVRHFCWWNRNVATPVQNGGSGINGKRAMILLTKKILKKIVLRRTKKGRAADLALPPRIISLRRDTLDIKEQDYYDSLYSESRAQFNTYVQADILMNNYAHVFDLLTRLRQAVDHPYLVEYSQTRVLRRETIFVDNGEHACGICHDPAEDPVVTSCEHVFCKSCLIDYSAALGRVSCPSCSTLLTVDLNSNKDAGNQASKPTIKGFRSSSILNRIQLENFQSSTKIEALREEIRFMVERDGSAKGIIFSQFTSFLDLINYSLQKSGISCVQLVGSMSLASRDAAIKRFTDDPECKIFLMSLKAGGVALNLTVSSHVFLMDPWWNPAVERQAQDRIHRIGQYKPIRIVRFVIENTVEERILKLQEKKELVFEGTIGGSSEALGKLTEADLRFLFN